MQETSYQNLMFKDLARLIIENGDMKALSLLNAHIAQCNERQEYLNDLDCLILYYIYYIWMPVELRADCQVIRQYLTKDESDMWQIVLQDNSIIENTSEYSDIYQSLIFDLAQDIAWKHSNGHMGKSRDKDQFVFSILYNMNSMKYQQVTDYCLKVLFIGDAYYGKELFGSQIEYDLYHSFLFDKKALIYIEESDINNSQNCSIEESVLEMNLI